jgi:geranylgeranyl reductase family protein
VRRRELDQLVAANAVAAGARLLEGHEALQPVIDRGFVRGATVQDKALDGASREIRARYVVVADGANSRFGRALGTFRTRDWPYGTAIRTYWASPRHDEPWIESALDVKDRNGHPMPGYGWIFPVGDGTVNIGVGLLSTFRDFKSVNTTHLLDAYAHQVAERWEIDPGNPECKATSGRIPMGGSVGPKAGPTYLVVGDAAGSVNPFNGEGIDYAYETARMAANVLHDALVAGDPTHLQHYPRWLDEEYGEYFKVARLFARVIGRPTLMRELTRVGMHSRTLMEWVLRIMANLLRPDELGPAEAAYKAAALIVRFAPNS